MKTFHKRISKENLYKEYVLIINGLLQLSFREAEVFSLLLKLNDQYANLIADTGDLLSTDIRRIVMRETRISKTNLVKYINILSNKNIIIRVADKKWKMNEQFVPQTIGDINEIVFILDTK
jgi:hypothetical protein